MDREKILQEIFECFQQITQWIPNSFDVSNSYYSKAEVLIELLETEDCGHIGGYDHKNPVKEETSCHLYDRFLCLVRKHNSVIKPCCGFTIKTLGKYFDLIHDARDKVLSKVSK